MRDDEGRVDLVIQDPIKQIIAPTVEVAWASSPTASMNFSGALPPGAWDGLTIFGDGVRQLGTRFRVAML